MKFKLILIIFFLFYVSYVFADKQVHAHYLSWFQSKDDKVNSYWGSTWQADGHTPDYIDPETGQRDISAAHYSLIGPYDSDDFKSLEYHILLAQGCGLRGFVVDWFGTNSQNKIIKDGFEALASTLTYLNSLNNNLIYSNFKLSISYDEQALEHYSSSYSTYASNDIEYIKNNYAQNSYYYTNTDTGKPLLMIWEYFTYLNKIEWATLLNKFTNFFAVDFREYPDEATFSSHFPWVDGFTTDGMGWGESYLNIFYSGIGTNSFLQFATGGVWPGFDEKGWISDNPRLIKRQELKVYQNTWDKVFSYSYANPLNLVQIITWNDWGEGTEIEPSVEYGYKYIKETRAQVNSFLSENFNNDLALLVPQYIYNARLSVDQGITSSDNTLITNALKNFYSGDYYKALTNSTKAMGSGIPQIYNLDRGNGKIILKWSKTANAQGYKIYTGISSNYINLQDNFIVEVISDINKTNAVISGLDNALDYYCGVSSYVGEKDNEARYKIEGWVSTLQKVKGDSVSPSPVLNFRAEKVNNQIKFSWQTPDDSDYYSTYICFMASSRYPQTPFEGTKVIQVTNSHGIQTEYFYKNIISGYKYFSAFAMDKVENYSSPSYARVFIAGKSVKLAGNFIIPAEGKKYTLIYIDTEKSSQKVKIRIYNLKGKLIKDFEEKQLSVGRNQFIWPENEGELNEIPSGVYILSVTGDIEQKEKIVVVK